MKSAILRFTLTLIKRFTQNDVIGEAAQTAFYLIMSMPPLAVFAIVLINRIDPAWDMLHSTLYLLPDVVLNLLELLANNNPSSGVTLVSGVALIFSASGSVWAMMKGVHKSYTTERLGFSLGNRFTAFIFTIIFALSLVLSVIVIITGGEVASALLSFLGIHKTIWTLLRRLVSALPVLLFICALYLFTPKVKSNIKTVLPGAVIATIGWQLATFLFEQYIAKYTWYSLISGIGTFLALAIWLYIISFLILCGAEINASIKYIKSASYY